MKIQRESKVMVYWRVTHTKRQQNLVLPFKFIACPTWKSLESASCYGTWEFSRCLILQWGSLIKQQKPGGAGLQSAPALAVWGGRTTVKNTFCVDRAGSERIWDMLRWCGGTGWDRMTCSNLYAIPRRYTESIFIVLGHLIQ